MQSFNKNIIEFCLKKNNRLCIGLDIDNEKLSNQSVDYMRDFIFDIIDSTIDHCPIYKINFAFYEKHGSKGYEILEKIPDFINGRAITIADAKRGDIGNSSKYYSNAILNLLGYDSMTISPYMGEDSIEPFIQNENKGIFILCLTSNSGSSNFQKKKIGDKELYLHVSELAVTMNVNNNIGLVVGATQNNQMEFIKNYSADLPWLIPGVGFQGGSLEDSIIIGSKNNSTPIINISRGIIYAGNGTIDDIRIATEDYTKKIRNIL